MSHRKFHIAMTVLWALLAVPTILFWRESILWVAFMSLYANVASHWAAAEAARSDERAERRSTHG
jgi:hypothetical protein